MLDFPIVLYMMGDILYAMLPWRGQFRNLGQW